VREKSRWLVNERKTSLEKLREEKVAGKSVRGKGRRKVNEREKSLEKLRDKKSLVSQ